MMNARTCSVSWASLRQHDADCWYRPLYSVFNCPTSSCSFLTSSAKSVKRELSICPALVDLYIKHNKNSNASCQFALHNWNFIATKFEQIYNKFKKKRVADFQLSTKQLTSILISSYLMLWNINGKSYLKYISKYIRNAAPVTGEHRSYVKNSQDNLFIIKLTKWTHSSLTPIDSAIIYHITTITTSKYNNEMGMNSKIGINRQINTTRVTF